MSVMSSDGEMEIDVAPRAVRPKRLHVAQPWSRAGTPTDLSANGMDLLGRWIRESRDAAVMTQAQLARIAGIHQSTLSRLERGRLQGLQLHKLAAVIGALDTALGRSRRRMIG